MAKNRKMKKFPCQAGRRGAIRKDGWLPVKINPFDEPQSEEVRGVQVNLFLSPYDIPEAVNGAYDKDRDRFVIQFRYISEEPTRRETIDQFVGVRVGKNSGRVYEIEINTKALGAHQVQLTTIVPVIGDALAKSRAPKDNIDVTKRIIEDQREELFKDLVPA